LKEKLKLKRRRQDFEQIFMDKKPEEEEHKCTVVLEENDIS